MFNDLGKILFHILINFGGTTISIFSIYFGIVIGDKLPTVKCANMALLLWIVAFLNLIILYLIRAFALRSTSWSGTWIYIALIGYFITLFIVQPSARSDGNWTAAAIWSAIWLAPIIVAAETLPRIGKWPIAVSCWCLMFGLSSAASCTVRHHGSVMIGLGHVVWD
jgi:hypothetical protein